MTISALPIWLPVVVSFVCSLFMLMGWRNAKSEHVRQTLSSAIWFYMEVAGLFLAWMLYRWYPTGFVAAYPICYFLMAFPSIALYKLTCSIADTRFSLFHYFAPLLLSLFMLVWSSLVPFEVKLDIITGYASQNSDYPIFSLFFTSILATMVLFSLIYGPLCVKNFRLYRKKMVEQESYYMFNWLKIALILLVGCIIIPLFILIFGREDGGIPLINFSAVVLSVSCVIMTVHVLKGDYPQRRTLLFLPISEKEVKEEEPAEDIQPKESNVEPKPIPQRPAKIEKSELPAFKQEIEQYFRSRKPYLDPTLKLEKLAADMGYTRNRFSALINLSFDMNYNSYINTWRLKEVENIARKLKSQKLSQAEIARRAGFGSYHSYLRARESQINNK